MLSNVVNPAAEKSLLPPLLMDSDAHYQLENLRLEDGTFTQPEYEAEETRLEGLSRIVCTRDPVSPSAEPDLRDATRTSAELEPTEISSKGVLEIALTYGYPSGGELVPQPDYRPHTANDRRRYVEQVQLGAPILFFTQGSTALGFPLQDALASRFMHLDGRDDPMFQDRGPSVHIRLVWPGYASWSRLIPTRDFRSPPQPVTRAKLARSVAKVIKRFIDDMTERRMEDEAEAKWRVGGRHIRVEDLVLVGLQHVSMGSWQAHVRVVWRQ